MLELLLSTGQDRDQASAIIDYRPEQSSTPLAPEGQRPTPSEPIRPEMSQSAQRPPGFELTVVWTLDRLNQSLDDLMPESETHTGGQQHILGQGYIILLYYISFVQP